MDRPFIGKGFYNIITNTASPLPLAIQRFNQRASEVQIQIEVKPPLELEQSVLHGQLHAAIGPYPLPISGLDYHPLFEEKQYLYCSNNHPFSSLKNISMKTNRSACIVARSYLQAAELKVLGVSSSGALIDNVDAQAMHILADLYFSFLPSHYLL